MEPAGTAAGIAEFGVVSTSVYLSVELLNLSSMNVITDSDIISVVVESPECVEEADLGSDESDKRAKRCKRGKRRRKRKWRKWRIRVGGTRCG